MNTKQCRKCNQIKSINDFYNDKSQKDGKQNICKICSRKNVDKYRAENPEKIKEQDKKKYQNNKEYYNQKNRERSESPERKEYLKKMYNTDKYRSKQRSKYHNCKKTKARISLNYHISKGNISKPDVCSICGSSGIIHGHHEDYNKPLDVVWCCEKCHNKIHEVKK